MECKLVTSKRQERSYINDFNKKEKVRVKKYLEKLEYFGLTPSRLHKDTKYAKFIGEIESSAIENYKKYKILQITTLGIRRQYSCRIFL